MKTLEELLQELGCEGSAFDSTGEFTKAGEKAYERLEHLLYDIESLTGKKVTPGKSSVSCPLKPSDSAPLC